VELAPYHTKGTQTVIIETNGERTILVPDNAYVMNNIEDLRAVGAAVSKDGNRTYLEKLKLLHSYPRTTVIPGHDVSIFKEFPLTQKNIARLR